MKRLVYCFAILLTTFVIYSSEDSGVQEHAYLDNPIELGDDLIKGEH